MIYVPGSGTKVSVIVRELTLDNIIRLDLIVESL